MVILRRNLDFRRKIVPDLGRAIVKGVVSIGAALWGFGVWSLVWGQMAGVLTAVLLSWTVVPWRPTFHFHRAADLEELDGILKYTQMCKKPTAILTDAGFWGAA